ncbi:MAG: hypothetical protein ACM3XQ_09925 [Nocardioidaceae bacterium]
MHDGHRDRRGDQPRLARRAITLTMAACLLVSCSTGETQERAADSDRTASTAPSGSAADQTRPRAAERGPDAAVAALPEVPSTDDPAALARQLDLAVVTLRDGEAGADDVRRAGQFQQLAVRTLATEPTAFRRQVTSRLPRETALVTGPLVSAASQLHALTEPEPKLPSWRILAPPPAEKLIRHYREAQRRTGVHWTYLAAIHLVETRMGRIRGTSSAGARGPMQFIPPTWETYGAGGDINDFRDSILAAARLLKANGAPGDMAEALYHYNPSDYYVRAVSAYARTMQRSTQLYRGYWHWRVLYRHERGTYVLPVGYPKVRPVLLHGSQE